MTRQQAIDFLKKKPYKFGHMVGFTKLTPLHNQWMRKMLKVNGEEYTTRNGIRGAAGEVPLTKLEGNQVFLLSDHRGAGDPDSRDSALGPVDMRKIKGNVLFRIWPLKQIASMRYR